MRGAGVGVGGPTSTGHSPRENAGEGQGRRSPGSSLPQLLHLCLQCLVGLRQCGHLLSIELQRLHRRKKTSEHKPTCLRRLNLDTPKSTVPFQGCLEHVGFEGPNRELCPFTNDHFREFKCPELPVLEQWRNTGKDHPLPGCPSTHRNDCEPVQGPQPPPGPTRCPEHVHENTCPRGYRCPTPSPWLPQLHLYPHGSNTVLESLSLQPPCIPPGPLLELQRPHMSNSLGLTCFLISHLRKHPSDTTGLWMEVSFSLPSQVPSALLSLPSPPGSHLHASLPSTAGPLTVNLSPRPDPYRSPPPTAQSLKQLLQPGTPPCPSDPGDPWLSAWR